MIVVVSWLYTTYYMMARNMWTDARYILRYMSVPMLLA